MLVHPYNMFATFVDRKLQTDHRGPNTQKINNYVCLIIKAKFFGSAFIELKFFDSFLNG